MAITQTFLGHLVDTSNASSYSLGNVSPSESGLLVICALARNATTAAFTGITVDGVGASVVVNSTTLQNPGMIAAMEVTAGTYAIGATLGATVNHCSVSVYLITGYASATAYSAGATTNNSSVTSLSLSLNYPAGSGQGIYASSHGTTGASGWSNATPDHDTTIEGTKKTSANRTASGSSVSETVTWTSSSGVVLGAVWEPSSPSAANRRRRSLICGAV